MKAYWKKGSKFSADATKVHNELERIREKNDGSLVPAVVVHEAKRKNSPLHKDIYRLSDNDAAAEHRLEIARKMIRSIEVVYEEAPEIQTRRYEVVTEPAVRDAPERKVYRDKKEILENPLLRDELLARAIRDAITYRKKYHELSELSQVFAALDSFLMENKAV